MNEHNESTLNALSKLNSELVNIQRELARSNKLLKLETERYQALSEMMANFAYGIEVGEHGVQIDWVTDSCHKVTGYTAKELPHKDGVLQIIHRDDMEQAKKILDRVINEKKKLSLQYRLVAKNSEIRYIMNYYQPIIDDVTQQATRVYVATQDVTVDVLIEQTRQKLVTQENRFKILSDFVMLLSHEFFTPISTIKTSVHLLSRVAQNDRQQLHLQKIDKQADSITALINSLQTLIKLDEREIDLELQVISLEEMVNNIISRYDELINNKSLQVAIELDDQMRIRADNEYLSIAVGNIIKNAIQFSKQNGTISIRSYQTTTHDVIEIQDEGIGIKSSDLPFIYERFYRSDQARTVSGSGLGLTIAKELVDQHQGEIEVETNADVGSVFRILLPIN